MDADHKELVRRWNLLVCAGAPPAGSVIPLDNRAEPTPTVSDPMNHFRALIDLLRDHFRREEALMESIDYPDLEPHKSEHSILTAELVRISRELAEAGGEGLSEDALENIKRCCFDHFVTEDRRLAEFYFGERTT